MTDATNNSLSRQYVRQENILTNVLTYYYGCEPINKNIGVVIPGRVTFPTASYMLLAPVGTSGVTRGF